MSNGQMRDDIRLHTECRCPVGLVSRIGGNIITHDQVLAAIRAAAKAG